MITHISIKDFAIIETADIDFEPGLNIITGETGAGKSIVIEAVSLALGSRADTAFVRSGKNKAVVSLCADLGDEEYVVTREVSATGKNLCKINGEIVTLAQLSALCRRIADIHGQYDHQSLLNPDYHIRLVDSYRSDEILPAKEAVSTLYQEYTQIKHKLNTLLSGAAENERKRDFMRFEFDEIEKAALLLGEDDALSAQIEIQKNSETIYEALAAAYELTLGGEPSASDNLDRAFKLLEGVNSYSQELSDLSEGFSDIYYRLSDICSDIRKQRDKCVFSPEELDEATARMEIIDTMKRKYGGSIETALSYRDEIAEKLSFIENIDSAREELTEKLATLEQQLKKACSDLSTLRKHSAEKLEEKIQKELLELNFNNSALSIRFEESGQFTESGTDIVEFLISTNRGEPLKPLSKIASGGEMSRIMLAFKNIIADYDKIPTMIFDEIDAGISGITAAVVGRKMKEIAENHQIICITHLPQIAAFGQYNYRIFKEVAEDVTKTTVEALNEEEKVLELARLVGGINVTEAALENARELIRQSK